jgi:hypothetical protein
MDLPKLRTSGRAGPKQAADETALPPAFPVNELGELVADLIEATGLVPADRLAPARGRAKQGTPFSTAVLEEGVATQEGIARTLASRFQLPFVDLALVGVQQEQPRSCRSTSSSVSMRFRTRSRATRSGSRSPTRETCRRSTSCGWRRASSSRSRRVARGHPRTRSAPRPRLGGVRRARRRRRGGWAFEEEEEEGDDLEVDDGISDAPLVRLVNSMIFQAAEDGASDVHFEPQEDSLVVRLRVDGVLHEVQRIPKRMMPGVTTRLKVLAKLDIAERRKPQDGRISLNAAAAGACSTSASRPADGRGRVDRDASPRQVEEGADARRARAQRGDAREARRDHPQADGRAPRHGPDRLR